MKVNFLLKNDTRELRMGYKYTSPSFATSPFQMINIPTSHASLQLTTTDSWFSLTLKGEAMLGINRFNETSSTVEKDGYEARLTLRADLKSFSPLVIPFAEWSIATLDSSVRNNNIFSFWVGLGFVGENRD